MATRSGEEIQKALAAFVESWRGYEGTERSEAQTFLNELIACYGSDRRQAGARFEEPQSSGGIVDLLWPDNCIVEMKAPREADRLERHREQALDYWHHSDDPEASRPAPPWLLLCAFDRFEVWEPGRFPSGPRDTFTLEQLPDRYESLQFFAEQEPLFLAARRELTTEATKQIVDLSRSLIERGAAPPEVVQRFALQIVWCLFAESLDIIEGRPIERIVEGLLADPARSSAAELGHLFAALDDDEGYARQAVYAGAPYANGGLFAEPARVHLNPDELGMLAEAAEYEWRSVDPTIFGSLMEGYLGRDRRWELGAHYTHEVDILKIVRPTVIEPWRDRIDAVASLEEAERALADLCAFRVLDPAAGCGNFLYVAYRELRELEARAHERIRRLHREAGVAPPQWLPKYPISNISGLEVDDFAVALARVTMWMGHKLAADTYGVAEPVLPLVDLSGIRRADALREEWPEADAVIGNPPFNGSQHLRSSLGDEYVEWLKQEFSIGVKDYCVYWFRKAHDHLRPGGRAGLVGTKSVSQNRARSESLAYVTANGGVITDAVSKQKWPGDANVTVSLVNWVREPVPPPQCFSLDGRVVEEGISEELQPAGLSTNRAKLLAPNQGIAFQGPIPVGEGFILSAGEAKSLLERSDADYSRVVRPYLTGRDLAEDPEQSPSRWVIDFVDWPLERAYEFSGALDILRERVKPERERNPRKARRERWWQFGEKALGLRSAVLGLTRFIVGNEVGKRPLFAWCEPQWCPSNKCNVFALSEDADLGVLSSGVHGAWTWARSGTLETRISYTPTSVFETFPWPQPDNDTREEIAACARDIVGLRRDICTAEQIGLTTLYNWVDDGAYTDLKRRHLDLDQALAAAYGWPSKAVTDSDEIVRRLLALNIEIADDNRDYAPFGRPDMAGEQTAISYG